MYNHYSQNKKNVYAMFFDGSVVQGRGVEFLFKTLNSMKSNDHYIDELRLMVKNQSNAFPKSQDFDFRTLFAEDVNLMKTLLISILTLGFCMFLVKLLPLIMLKTITHQLESCMTTVNN